MPGPYDGAMTRPAGSPLDEATARVGDRWTLLLVQALLDGPRRFNELLEALPGIAPNVLSQRQTVVVSQPYSRRPPRFAYGLTASGRELAGALRLLAQWGADRSGSPDAEGLRHLACGTPLEARWFCPTCAHPVDDDDTGDLRFM
jgi:DNA-binding HxlR family transcriptional regulator